MAQKKKGGLINRLIMGSEKSEGYARASLPSNRWELFWDIFKGRFWKLVVINLLMLVFFLPLFALLFMRNIAVINYGSIGPFAQGFGVGYQAVTSLVGYSQSIMIEVNLISLLFLPIAVVIAAIGVAGGAYVIRNMIWTEGIFVANDFWRGIKQNVGVMIVIGMIYSIVFYLSEIALSFSDLMLATGSAPGWVMVVSKVATYIVLVLYSIMTFHMITMCVTYKLKFRQLLKNTFLFTIGLFLQNIFFLFLGLLPIVFILIGSIFSMIGYILLILFFFSYCLLVWTDFCHWAYDKFINDKVPGAQKNRGIYEKVKESDSESLKKYRDQLAMGVRSSLNSKPIKPITDDELKLAELPQSFNRNDIEKLNESRRILYEDHERYVEEHKNDPEFQPTEEEKAMEKDRLEREKRIEAAKKELSKRKGKK